MKTNQPSVHYEAPRLWVQEVDVLKVLCTSGLNLVDMEEQSLFDETV